MEISPEITRLIDEIKEDRTHGASELARQAVKVLKTAARQSPAADVALFLAEQKLVGEALMSARPAMAPLYNSVRRLVDIISSESREADLERVRRITITVAEEITASSLRAVTRIAEHAANLIKDGDVIMTHSYSSTVSAALAGAYARRGGIEVIVTRSGPGRTGERIARDLAGRGITVTFIDDAAIGIDIARTDKVMVGADRICADGSLINGVGTYLLALAADRAGVPFYVLSETLKFDTRFKGEEVNLEEKAPAEVLADRTMPPVVRVRNPYFDVTPLELISGVVTEEGLLTAVEVAGYLQKLLA